MTAPTPEDRLYKIVEDGMCIGCGLCQSVAGADRVRVRKVASGYEHPVVVGPLDHEMVDRIYDVCPGTRVEGLPDRLASETDPGTNALMIRTAAGAKLVEAAVAESVLVLGEEVAPDFMNRVPPHQTKKRYAVNAHWGGLAAEGRTVPRSARLRLDALAEAHGSERNLETTEGTRRRVRDGKTSEERPA